MEEVKPLVSTSLDKPPLAVRLGAKLFGPRPETKPSVNVIEVRQKTLELRPLEVRPLSVQPAPIISERVVWNHNHVFLAFFIGIIIVFTELVSVYVLDLNTTNAVIFGLSLLVLYGIALFFLLEPRILREVKTKELRAIDRPFAVTKEIIVEKPVEVVRTVEPVVRKIYVDKPIYIRKPVYIERRRKKLVIPHYNFAGSSLTKTYHTSNCRLGKSIKRKYKVHDNKQSFFIKKLYRPCEVCILKRKKV